jgi:hypothetical protein
MADSKVRMHLIRQGEKIYNIFKNYKLFKLLKCKVWNFLIHKNCYCLNHLKKPPIFVATPIPNPKYRECDETKKENTDKHIAFVFSNDKSMEKLQSHFRAYANQLCKVINHKSFIKTQSSKILGVFKWKRSISVWWVHLKLCIMLVGSEENDDSDISVRFRNNKF